MAEAAHLTQMEGGESRVKTSDEKQDFEPMKVEDVGHVGDVLRQGGGKLSIPSDDSGEDNRKPKGQE